MTGDPLPTGVAAVDQTVLWSVAVVTVAGALALLVRLLRGMGRIARTMDDFAEDWHGEPGRPGVPRRPGVMERLSGIESLAALHAARLEGVERKLGIGAPEERPPIRAVP